MPLMRPEIQAVLRSSGLDAVGKAAAEKAPLSDLLESVGLGLEKTLENLAETANSSANESLRIRANETALKMHGALKETVQTQMPSFTIVINDSYGPPAGQIISQSSTDINPILMPRQLHAKLKEAVGKEAAN